MKQVFEWIVEQGGEIAILSDANTVYISTILKHLGMDHLVTEIITNRGFFEDSGRLRVERFWKESEEPHGCPNGCAPNLCKGKELKRLMSLKAYERVYYLGDGRNDYCPSVHLKECVN
jgi:pyridoxal phosphate phosphatase PHOSPHO2